MKDLETRMLYELMKDSRRSDRELSRIVGVSQPTVSRTLRKMQKDLGLTFSASMDLAKAGFELIGVTFGKKQEKPMDQGKIQELLEEYRNSIIFASTGTCSGIDADRMIISVHKNYTEYANFREYLRTAWEGLVMVGDSFLMSLRSDKVIRPLSTHYLFETQAQAPRKTGIGARKSGKKRGTV